MKILLVIEANLADWDERLTLVETLDILAEEYPSADALVADLDDAQVHVSVGEGLKHRSRRWPS